MRFAKCIGGNCTSFAVIYSIGNIISICGTFFLSGPAKQLKQCFDPDRICATCTMMICLVATLVVALVHGIPSGTRIPLVILCCLAQLLAYLWYCVSYIPFARSCIKNAIK